MSKNRILIFLGYPVCTCILKLLNPFQVSDLHGERASDGDDNHPLGEVHTDEERSLSDIDMEGRVHDLNVFVAENLSHPSKYLADMPAPPVSWRPCCSCSSCPPRRCCLWSRCCSPGHTTEARSSTGSPRSWPRTCVGHGHYRQ